MEEIESSSLKELSKDSYEIITQKLCDKGANHNIKSVKEKVRGTKKIVYFLERKIDESTCCQRREVVGQTGNFTFV